MKTATLIQAHKSLEQLQLLLRALDEPGDILVVHMDAKSPISGAEIAALPVAKAELRVVPEGKRVDVRWGAFSQIEATLAGLAMIREILPEIDYVHLVSGQDLPLLSASERRAFFQAHQGQQFINVQTDPAEVDKVRWRWDYYPVFMDRSFHEAWLRRGMVTVQRLLGLKRTPPEGFRIHRGRQWWSLTGPCLAEVLDLADQRPDAVTFLRRSHCADELFFQNFVLVSSFADRIAPQQDMRYVDFQTGPEFPRTLRWEDKERLESSGKLWARKFDLHVDPKIIAYVLEKIGVAADLLA